MSSPIAVDLAIEVAIARGLDGEIRVEIRAETCEQCGERVSYWNDDGLTGGSGNASCACCVEGPEACDPIMMRPTALALIVEALRGLAPGAEVVARERRQAEIFAWAKAAFSEIEATDLGQRGVRLLEEAIEAFQACGGHETIAHELVSFVFARPAGSIGQELGGVGVTVLALAAAAGLSADAEEAREVARVLSKPIDEFTRRNAAKNAAGFRVIR